MRFALSAATSLCAMASAVQAQDYGERPGDRFTPPPVVMIGTGDIGDRITNFELRDMIARCVPVAERESGAFSRLNRFAYCMQQAAGDRELIFLPTEEGYTCSRRCIAYVR